MRIRSIICLIILLITLPAMAQSKPEIISFSYDGIPLVYDDVEQGIAASDFLWDALNVGDGYQMQMHAFVGGQWALIGEGFEAAKSDRLVIAHPLSFSLPHYRLSIVDAANNIIDEAHLYLAYADTDPDALPQIVDFEISETEVSRQALINGSALLQVSWGVNNRTATSNLIFEQVLPDGSLEAIELPRFEEWVRSEGQGVIAPIYTGDEDNIMTQIRLVDINTGETYSSMRVAVGISDDIAAIPTPAPTATEAVPLRHLIEFDTPYLVTLGDATTLRWDASVASELADEVVIREWHEVYFGGKYGAQVGHIDVEGEVPFREWTGLALNGELEIPVIDDFPPSTLSFRDVQNVVIYALYLKRDGEMLGEDGYIISVHRPVYLRSVEEANNCTPTMSAPEQAISAEGFTVSWDFCGIPFVRIELTNSNGQDVPTIYPSGMPNYSAGSRTYVVTLDDHEQSVDIHVRIFNTELDVETETTVKIVRS